MPLALALALAGEAAGQSLLQGQATAPPTGLERGRYWLTATRDEGKVALAGLVPDALTRTVLATYAAALFGAAAVEGAPAERDGGPALPADWTTSAMAALDTLASLEHPGAVELTEVALTVSGEVAEPEEAGQLTRALQGKLPPGLRVTTEFRVPEPDVSDTLTLSPQDCAMLMTRIATQRQILFASGSAEIEDDSLPALERIAALFERCPTAEIEIAGYTDNRGPEDVNLDLSQARAEAVLAVLQDTGIPIRRLRARGFGAADPIADNETEAGRARNRRIEFRAVE